MTKLAVVIPLFNEADNVVELRARLAPVLEASGCAWEVLFIDDGSRDGTAAALRRIHGEDPRWKALLLSRNFGHGAACTAGLSHVDADAVVLMDGDLQDPPELIAQMLAKWREGFGVVYAARTDRSESWARKAVTGFFYRLLDRMSSVAMPLDAGIFSLLDRSAVEALRSLPERHRYLTGLRAWIGFKQAGVAYRRQPRHASQPKQTFVKLSLLALDALFGFSNIPLRLATLMGALMAAGSLLFAAKVVYEKLFTDKPIIGWSSTLVAITLTGGAILLTLGIIGEYLGRIYDEVKRRPIYLVAERLGVEPAAPAAS